MPGWVLAALSLTLILPALVGSIDAFARARRRKEPVARWLRWLAAQVLPFAAALVLAELLALAGATPEPPSAPVAPDLNPLDAPALLVLGAVIGAAAALWAAGRFVVVRADPALEDHAAPGAACAVCLALSVTVLLLWVVNPYAALVLVPAVHLWLLATIVDPGPPRRARLILVGAGLLLPALVGTLLPAEPLAGPAERRLVPAAARGGRPRGRRDRGARLRPARDSDGGHRDRAPRTGRAGARRPGLRARARRPMRARARWAAPSPRCGASHGR